LAYFLPLLFLLTASSPLTCGERYGQSFRLAHSYAIGAPEKHPTYRFQDIIFSKRLGTIEVKIFDPWWDMDRIRIIAEALDRICRLDKKMPFDIAKYKRERREAAKEGYGKHLKALHKELNNHYPIHDQYLIRTPADEVSELYEKHGALATYSALDSAYRGGDFKPQKIKKTRKNIGKVGAGIVGYWVPRLPYRVWKYWKDWR
jgi:gamma-glutamyl:cysteine ligase YbdK (ATP-grasp superfamily)